MRVKEEKFKNEPSRKLYNALTTLMHTKKLTAKDIAAKFGQYEATPRNFFNAVSSAKISVTVDQILKAKEFFGIDPCKLFTENNDSKQEKRDNEWILNEDDDKNPDNDSDITSKDLLRIIEKQQETIHFLTTGRSQGGGQPPRKKAS